jgi:putative endonuclease
VGSALKKDAGGRAGRTRSGRTGDESVGDGWRMCTARQQTVDPPGPVATARQAFGAAAEQQALDHLLAQGLKLVQRNYRVARGRSAAAGEVDLILRDRDGTLVFVEVRARRDLRAGGAAASVGATKRKRLVFAAAHFLSRLPVPPPCRFDVVAIDGDRLDWLRAAFDAG